MKKNTLLYFILPMFIGLLSSCENDIAVVNTIAPDNYAETPVESSRDVEFIYSDSAQIKMKLLAKKIDRFVKDDNTHFEMSEGLNMFFYNQYPEVQTELKADYGIGYNNSNGIDHMEVERNVVVINEVGDKLNTEHLIWNAVKKNIYTDQFVKITTKNEVIWGDGLEASEDFSKYEIKNVKGQIKIKDTIQ